MYIPQRYTWPGLLGYQMSQLGQKFLYIYQIQVVVFEIFKIGQETKKVAPTVPEWASYSLGAQGFLEVVRSAQ